MIEETRIIDILSIEFGRELTIRQISKELAKSYAYTNNKVRQMIAAGILGKKVIGSAIVCTINYHSEKALGLLVMNSIIKRELFIVDNPKLKETSDILLSELPEVDAIFTIGESLFVLTDEELKMNQKLMSLDIPELSIVDRESFKPFIMDKMGNLNILYGYEILWRLLR